jgi:hypothetical protein
LNHTKNSAFTAPSNEGMSMRFLTYLIALPMLGFMLGCPPDDPVDESPPDAPLVVSDGTACGDACANMVNCTKPENHTEKFSECKTACSEDNTEDLEIITCVASSSCEGIAMCGSDSFQRKCSAVTEKVLSCGNTAPLLDMLTCKGLDETYLECLQNAECDNLAACLTGSQRAACGESCAKYSSCGHLLGQSESNCIKLCLSERGVDRFNACVERTDCVDLEHCIGIEGSCSQACSKMIDCDTPNIEDQANCELACVEVDDAKFSNCVINASCEQINSCGAL